MSASSLWRYIFRLSTELIVTAPLDYSMHNQGSAQMTSNTVHNDGHDELVQAKWELQGVYSMTPFFCQDRLAERACRADQVHLIWMFI